MKVYTKTVCPKCMLVKSLLDDKELSYEIVNIDQDEEGKNKLITANIMSVPVVEYKDTLYTGLPEINKLISDLTE